MTPSIRTAREITDAKRTGAHFTPPSLADYVARRILNVLPTATIAEGIEVLDPSCGDGELLRAFIESTPLNVRSSIKLVGIEDNDSSLAETRKRLERDHANYELLHADFLDVSDSFSQLPSLQGVLFDANVAPILTQPDVIIANPPYVRTQVLGAERAQQLAARFQLKGRVDLYHAFLIAMTDVLKPGGVLGVITSNRFLTIRSGETVREFLTDRYDLLEVIDLGDTKLFSAAVLPAVVIARKRSGSNSVKAKPNFVRVYEAQYDAAALPRHDLLTTLESGDDGRFNVEGKTYEVTSGALTLGVSARDPWRMTTKTETAWTQQVEQSTPLRIADVAKVRVGIKTTADKVFIRDDWDALPQEQRPENEVLRPLYTHFEADRWLPDKPISALLKILYTHETIDGKRRAIDFSKYPRAKKYLESNRARLESRTFVIEAGRQWYEIWVPQDPAAWLQPKIIFPDISAEPRFFYDEGGALVNGDCYWITLDKNNEDLLFLMQGVANSSITTRYHDLAFQNKLYSGRRRYISQFVERYPIPNPDADVSKSIVAIVKEILKAPIETRSALEIRLDSLVARALNVQP